LDEVFGAIKSVVTNYYSGIAVPFLE